MKLHKNLFSLTLASFSLLITVKVARAITTVNDPNNSLASINDFTGVVSLQVLGEHFCTASLLDGGHHILTAAHCLTNASNFLNANLDDMNVVFSLPQNQFSIGLSEAFILPEWNGDGSLSSFIQGGDLAVLKLTEKAPKQAEQYKIYRNSDEIGQIAKIAGYGNYGTGLTGGIEPGGQKKIVGKNKFEVFFDAFEDLLPVFGLASPISPESQLIGDFDNGLSENDALGVILGINDLGLRNQEVSPSVGDSGAPWFIKGKIAGIVSYRVGSPFIPNPPDIDDLLNSSFGEIFSSTRVSIYTGFIDNVLAGNVLPTDFGLFTPSYLEEEIPLSSFQDQLVSSAISVPEQNFSLGLLTFAFLGSSARIIKKLS